MTVDGEIEKAKTEAAEAAEVPVTIVEDAVQNAVGAVAVAEEVEVASDEADEETAVVDRSHQKI